MVRKIRKFLTGKDGATAIEYGLIAALVSVAAIGALGAMGGSLGTMFNSVANHLSSAVTASIWRAHLATESISDPVVSATP